MKIKLYKKRLINKDEQLEGEIIKKEVKTYEDWLGLDCEEKTIYIKLTNNKIIEVKTLNGIRDGKYYIL